MVRIRDEHMKEFKKIAAEKGIEFKNEGEALKSAQKLVELTRILMESAHVTFSYSALLLRHQNWLQVVVRTGKRDERISGSFPVSNRSRFGSK